MLGGETGGERTKPPLPKM